MSNRYVAVIPDAAASRLLPPARRARLQQDARAAAQQLNRGYARVLAARFAVTLGDELQCLLPGPAPVWEIAHQIRARLPAVDWVVACGLGPLSTPLAPTAPEIDGHCLHAARAALARAPPPRQKTRARLSTRPRRPGTRQSPAPGFFVWRLPSGVGPARELLRRPL